MAKRLIIVGGVAGGATAAARARRLSEDLEIIMIERGPYVSFANCGLPYYLGNVIKDRKNLLLHTPESLKARFNIDVRVLHEVVEIFPERREIRVKDLSTNNEYLLSYDALILSPGAEPFIPDIPGINLPNVFTLKTLIDLDSIIEHIKTHTVRHATVIGGGFIGIEAAENIRLRGINVTLIEKENQVMPQMDPEMASIIHQHLRIHGIDLKLGVQATKVNRSEAKTIVSLSNGQEFETDLIILAIGVRPAASLAQKAGLKLGARGGISTDDYLMTSFPDIYAIGDVIETRDLITGENILVPLAGPANRQGRIAADNVINPKTTRYRGTLGTWICKIFNLTAAQTGSSEKKLKKMGKPYLKVYLHSPNHAGYYPGAFPMAIKMLFSPDNGEIFGVQIVGSDGVDKRIDVFATAIAAKMKATDLIHLELAYAPPYGSAKDPVNVAGMLAENILKGLLKPIYPEEIESLPTNSVTILDVRGHVEHEAGRIPGAINIPLEELRDRYNELPRDKEVIIYCQIGFKGYLAHRILTSKGFKCRNLIGGYKTWTMFHEDLMANTFTFVRSSEDQAKSSCSTIIQGGEVIELDACGLQCPGPLLKMKQKMEELKPGQMLKVTATDPGFLVDAAAWCKRSGNKLLHAAPEHGHFVAIMQKLYADVPQNITTPSQTDDLKKKNKLTMIVFSNDLDKAYAAFIIANGAASMGIDTTMFFTFWGLNILRKRHPEPVEKSFIEKMFGLMMPQGPEALTLSKMHFAGLGTMMMKNVMASKNVPELSDLIQNAKKSGVKLVACTMTMDVMGLKKAELIDGVTEGGVATYIDSAADSGINLFI